MNGPGTTYLRRPELNAVEMDGELVMMGQDQGEYFGMRDVAASIWQLLEQPRTVDQLADLVSDEYSVAPETCRPDIEAFLAELVDKRLVTVTG